MSQPLPTLVLTVALDDDLLTLNRVVGIMRRHNLAVGGLAVGPGPKGGQSRLTCTVASDPGAVDRMANALRKTVGVRDVTTLPESACTTREHLLLRLRHGPSRLSALLDVLALYEARILEETPEELVVEATGAAPLLGSLLRALEPYGVLAQVRGGAVALPRTALPTAGRDVPPVTVPAAIPA